MTAGEPVDALEGMRSAWAGQVKQIWAYGLMGPFMAGLLVAAWVLQRGQAPDSAARWIDRATARTGDLSSDLNILGGIALTLLLATALGDFLSASASHDFLVRLFALDLLSWAVCVVSSVGWWLLVVQAFRSYELATGLTAAVVAVVMSTLAAVAGTRHEYHQLKHADAQERLRRMDELIPRLEAAAELEASSLAGHAGAWKAVPWRWVVPAPIAGTAITGTLLAGAPLGWARVLNLLVLWVLWTVATAYAFSSASARRQSGRRGLFVLSGCWLLGLLVILPLTLSLTLSSSWIPMISAAVVFAAVPWLWSRRGSGEDAARSRLELRMLAESRRLEQAAAERQAERLNATQAPNHEHEAAESQSVATRGDPREGKRLGRGLAGASLVGVGLAMGLLAARLRGRVG
jgi:hypothetical protein